MELLKEIAKDKLVIMVTHNPELAELYSTRIVRLKDGRIVSDTNPYNECDRSSEQKKQKKVSMSFFTALSLSFNNLRTKKGRTVLTSFAGSIGIIGIALILALSTGMNAYISSIQKETMTAYPITINSKTFDASVLMGLRSERTGSTGGKEGERAGVYADYREIKTSEAVVSGVTQNNLTSFKKYLDDPNSEIQGYLGENGVIYGYDVAFGVYSYDAEGRFVDSASDPEESGSFGYPSAGSGNSFLGGFAAMMSDTNSAQNFSELMVGANGEPVSQVVTDSYELLYGVWPAQYDEVVLVLDKSNSVSAETLYQLGLITLEEYRGIVETIKNGEEAEELVFDYADVCSHRFYLVAACDYYLQKEDGTFLYIDDVAFQKDALLANAVELKITGIVRPAAGASNANISTAVAYTSKLTDHIIEHTAGSPVVTAQEKTPDVNVLNGLKFAAASDAEKISMTMEYISAMSVSEKASLYKVLLYYGAGSGTGGSAEGNGTADAAGNGGADGSMVQAGTGMPGADGSMAQAGVGNGTTDGSIAQAGTGNGAVQMGAMDDATMAAMLDAWLTNSPDPIFLLGMYEQYIGASSYEANMEAFGSVSYDAPSTISIYADNFENKEAIADCIKKYNDGVDENSRISYTDYVAMMTSSLTTIINGISYVLIAFVAVSLIVSCIMIGIITHISVMERTKEIGILRALGASKGNISQVFNAETFIIGCCSGLLGIGVTLLMLLPINSVIARLSGIADLSAQLPFASALVLIIISIAITMFGGLIPAKKAAKKDPVIALRTE